MKKGDIVRIIDLGKTYTTHIQKMRKMDFKNPEESRNPFFHYLNEIKQSVLEHYFFEVFSVDDIFVGIVDIFGNQILIDKNGLEKVANNLDPLEKLKQKLLSKGVKINIYKIGDSYVSIEIDGELIIDDQQCFEIKMI